MGNFLTRAAKLPKAVLLLMLVVLSSSLALSITHNTAFADGNEGPTGFGGQSMFHVKLTGSSNPAQYTVSATRASDNTTIAIPNKSGADFYSSPFGWGGDNSQCIVGGVQDTSKNFTWNFVVTANGKTANTKGVSYCSKADGTGQIVGVTIGVTDGQTTSPGSASGTFAYVDANDGTTKAFGSIASVTLTKGGSKVKLNIGNDGKFSATNLAPGTYVLEGYYNAPNGKTYTIPKTNEVITAGTNTTIALTVGADGKVTPGANIGDSTADKCDDGSSKDSNGICTGSTDDTLDCKGGAFNWLICPAILLMSEATQQIDTFITNTLDIDVKPIFDETNVKGSTSYGYYQAWSAFRVLATAILVIGGLVMVASQAIGFEFLDAYTIRKVLPRLLVAVIGISLSWPLMRFVVSFFDTLGFDVRSLIYAPFSSLKHQLSVGGGIFSTLAVGAGIFILGPASLTIVLSALLSVFIGFVVLVLRQIVIIMLIIIAPVAIACYILPNTERVWRLWQENFIGLLLAFPFISAVIAAGHVFSAVATSTGSSAGSLTLQAFGLVTAVSGHAFSQHIMAATANNIGGIVAQTGGAVGDYGPPFILGKLILMVRGSTAKLIGGSMGWANSLSQGLSGARSNAASKNWAAMGNNSRFDKNSKMGRFGNTIGTWVADPLNNAAYHGRDIPGFRKRGYAVAGKLEHAQAEQTGALFEKVNAMGFNDRGLRALSGMHYGLSGQTRQRLKDEGLYMKAPQSLQDIQRVAQIMSSSTEDAGEAHAGAALMGSSGTLATLYQDPEMSKASIAGAGIMGLSAHGFANSRDITNAANMMAGGKYDYSAADVEDPDKPGSGKMVGGGNFGGGHAEHAPLALSVATKAQLLGARSRPDIKAGYGMMYDGNGKFLDGMVSKDKGGGGRAEAVVKSLNSHDLASAKPGSVRRLNGTINEILDKGGPDATAVRDQIFSWAGPYSQASVDVKSEALEIINSRSAADPGGFGKEWIRYARMEDPDARAGGAPPDPGGAGGDGH